MSVEPDLAVSSSREELLPVVLPVAPLGHPFHNDNGNIVVKALLSSLLNRLLIEVLQGVSTEVKGWFVENFNTAAGFAILLADL